MIIHIPVATDQIFVFSIFNTDTNTNTVTDPINVLICLTVDVKTILKRYFMDLNQAIRCATDMNTYAFTDIDTNLLGSKRYNDIADVLMELNWAELFFLIDYFV